MHPLAIPRPDCTGANPEPNWLIVGQDGEGRWVVRDRLGLKGGIFCTFERALQFAKEESEAAHCCVVLSAPALVELGFDL